MDCTRKCSVKCTYFNIFFTTSVNSLNEMLFRGKFAFCLQLYTKIGESVTCECNVKCADVIIFFTTSVNISSQLLYGGKLFFVNRRRTFMNHARVLVFFHDFCE